MKMARALACLILAGCVDTPHFRGEGFSQYYRGPAEETQGPRRVESREILHWTKDPREKRRIGYLHRYEVQPKGSRDVRECYYISDASGTKEIGFITAEGVFYRFDARGRLAEPAVGAYTILTTGLKVFFGLPLSDNLDVEPIDPYR
jgi:hypothetical protein